MGRGSEITQRRIQQVVDLRRARAQLPDPRSEAGELIDRVAAAILDDVGDAVGPTVAARVLGVSPQALTRWMDQGLVPNAVGTSGRRRIPSSDLEQLATKVNELQASGRTRGVLAHALRSHAAKSIEKVISTGVPDRSLGARTPSGHRTAELRSLALHRLVAERLDEALLQRARERISRWLADGEPVDPYWAKRWWELLGHPLDEVARRITEDSQEMRDLRQATPFAGALSDAERLKIIEQVH